MIEIIKNKLQELYNILIEKPNRILGIFKDFYGEHRVDMQGLTFEDFKIWLSLTPIWKYMPYNIAVDLCNFQGTVSEYSNTNIRFTPPYELINIDAIDRLLDEYLINSISSSFKGGFILVYFPTVRVTNEHGRFVDITKLFAKVPITLDGQIDGSFSLNRAEYPILHLKSGYMHSHIPGIPTSDFTRFQSPCLGSGPIQNTISSLNKEFDEDLWSLFCFELELYTRTESIAGGPHRRMEYIGTSSMSEGNNSFLVINQVPYLGGLNMNTLKEFTKRLIHTKALKFNFVNGNYSIGMSFTDFIIFVSNEFIRWYNEGFNEGALTMDFEQLKSGGVVRECIIQGNKIFYKSNLSDIRTYSRYQGKRVCTFKGMEVTVNIQDLDTPDEDNQSIILNTNICLYVLTKILKVINFKYGNNTEQSSGNTEEGTSTQAREEIRFI